MNKLIEYVKKETVLCIALFLAVLSSFFVTPDKKYIDYVDFRTLAILFCLMAVVAGFMGQGVFDIAAGKLINRVGSLRAVSFMLVFMCLFLSMVITNDVALITFVPMTITLLSMAGEELLNRWMIPIIVMQTIAANLGSMLTPIGNPQNLYLYGLSKMTVLEFIGLMLPYTVLSMLLIVVTLLVIFGEKNVALEVRIGMQEREMNRPLVCMYGVLFVICILTVARIIPCPVTLAIVLVLLIIFDRSILGKVDYALLATFVGFFIFIGNMERISWFNDFVTGVLSGNEVIVSAVSSQVMSNVPAAVLLSKFTGCYKDLIVGTNLGGLGTLIASMASLISFKYVARQDKKARGRYFLYFTLMNFLFLAVLLIMHFTLL